MMDPCPENFVPAYEASQHPKKKFQWVWVECKGKSASLGFLSTEILTVTQAMQKVPIPAADHRRQQLQPSATIFQAYLIDGN